LRLVLAGSAFTDMLAHLRGCLPEEGCGFLVGTGETAVRFVPAPNALRSRREWEVAPGFLFGFFRDIRLRGEVLLALCHSHPRGEARLSESDIGAAAGYPDAFHVVVSFNSDEPRARAWRVLESEVVEVELHATI
jgi:proteasome lid subunit RPN8/RPN11